MILRPRRHRNVLEWTGVPWPARTGVGAAVAAGRRRLAWSVRRREHPARELGAGNDEAGRTQTALRDRHAHVVCDPLCQSRWPPISCGVSDFRGADFGFGVANDGSGGLPGAGLPDQLRTPVRILRPGICPETGALVQGSMIAASLARIRCDEGYRAVQVFAIVSPGKGLHACASAPTLR